MSDISTNIIGLRQIIHSAGWRRIGVDGVDAASNTDLAEELTEALEVPLLNVDDYLYQNQGGYIDFIDYPALKTALSSMPAFILCGLCLREILANLGTELDGHIYIMRMRDGLWMDEDECVFPEGVDAAIENLVSNTAALARHFDEPTQRLGFERDDDSLQRTFEVMRYHAAFLPQESADVIYEHGDPAR